LSLFIKVFFKTDESSAMRETNSCFLLSTLSDDFLGETSW